MIDIKETEVEIRVARDPDGGWRIWVNAPDCVLQACRVPKLHLTGLALTDAGLSFVEQEEQERPAAASDGEDFPAAWRPVRSR